MLSKAIKIHFKKILGSHENASSKEVIIYIFFYFVKIIIIISMKSDGQQYGTRDQLGEVKNNNY